MRVAYLPTYGLVSTGHPSATMERSLNCTEISERLVFSLKNNLPAYILVCTSPSAGIQPQTVFRPTASGLGQKAR